jgi:PAT family beta-lactamase induction signal transducer AmpG
LSFFAATQDIIIDTLRVEFLNTTHAGAGAAVESIGFRLGMLISGAGALYLASFYTWTFAYGCMALVEVLGIPALWFMPSHSHVQACNQQSTAPYTLRASFLSLKTHSPLFILIALMLLFKTCDTVLNAMSAPFLYTSGFNKIEYANISKSFGIGLMLVGGLVAGYLIHHFGRLLVAASSLLLQATSCFLCIIQYWIGHDIPVLMITIGVESFVSGMTSTAFIALIGRFSHPPYTAGHFTFLYAMGSLGRVITSSCAGFIADWFGWSALFFISAFSTIVCFYLLIRLVHHENNNR